MTKELRRNAERIADMPLDMVSADWISLTIIFSNLVKSRLAFISIALFL